VGGMFMLIVAVSDAHLGMGGADEQKFIDFQITRDFKEINQYVVVAFMCN
jgi:hypothetical protein